jgi:hypothetical protein
MADLGSMPVSTQSRLATLALHFGLQMPLDFVPREQEVTELALSMQDISTNLAVLIGVPGTGRTLLAASLAKELVETGYWQEAYWVDLQGVTSHKLAGRCLCALRLRD